MVGEVVVGETRFPSDEAAAGLAPPEVTVAMAVDSSREVARTSHDVSLLLPSPHRSSSPTATLSTEDVVHQFDATHRLSELTASWGDFATIVTSFGEKLQVSFLKFFLWMFIFLLFLCLFSFFLLVQSFSQDHTSFFFSSETKKKLSSELSALKTDLGLCQAELEAEHQMHQKEEQALRARVVEAEKQRDAAIQEALKNSESMKNLEAAKKECNGIAGSFCFLLYSNSPFC